MGWDFNPGVVYFRLKGGDYAYRMDDALIHKVIGWMKHKPGRFLNYCKVNCIEWRKL